MSLSSAAVRSATGHGATSSISSSLKSHLGKDIDTMTRDELVLSLQRAREKIDEQHRCIEQRDDELHRILEQNRTLSKKLCDARAQLSIARADPYDDDINGRESAFISAQSSAHQSLLSAQSLVSYGPPSPFYWKQIDEQEMRLKALGKHLKNIDRIGTQFCEIGLQYAVIANQLAMELCADWRDVEIESADNDRLSFGGTFRKLGEILKEVQVFQDILMFSIENTFLVRVREYRHKYQQPVKSRGIALHRLWDEYDSLIMKVLSSPVNASGKRRRFPGRNVSNDNDRLRAMNAKFQLASFDHVVDLNNLVTIRKVELLEGICACQYAFLAFFHSGHELSLSMNPYAKETQILLSHSMTTYNMEQRDIIRRRQILQQSLNDISNVSSSGSSLGRAHSTSPTISSAISQQTELQKHNSVDSYQQSHQSSTRTSRVVITKQGYLLKQSSNLKKDWKRRWFVLEDGQLFYYRPVEGHSNRDTDLVPEFVTNILICTVRLLNGSTTSDNYNGTSSNSKLQLPFCFEIISPNRRVYTLQGESDEDAQSWIDTIHNCTEFMLRTQRSQTTSSLHHRNLSFTSERNYQQERSDLISLVLTANSECADCNAPHPEWASINLCICICIECSGIHRSLGSHVSKVRSLMLDDISTDVLQLLLTIGNIRFNSVYESQLSPSDKPNPSSSRHVKEMFINAKYIDKDYIVMNDDEGAHIANEKLMCGAMRGDICEMMCAIGQGGSCSYCHPSDGRTPLHIAAQNQHLQAVQYLINQNQCDVSSLTHQGDTARDLIYRCNPQSPICSILQTNDDRPI